MTKLLPFHSSVLSSERSDMSDRLIIDQEAYIAHLFYIAQELKKKVVWYRPVITVEYPPKISFFIAIKRTVPWSWILFSN